MLRSLMLIGVCGLTIAGSLASAKDGEIERFHGKWKVVELVEDGKVIPEEVISEWLPSGGRFTIAENALQFTDHTDGKKQVKFSLWMRLSLPRESTCKVATRSASRGASTNLTAIS